MIKGMLAIMPKCLGGSLIRVWMAVVSDGQAAPVDAAGTHAGNLGNQRDEITSG